MIDKEKFLQCLALLAGAFGREVDGPIQIAYYRVLSPAMTTEEFQRAVEITMATETFWPSPAVLLGKVKADQMSRAIAAFEHVNRITASVGGYKFLPHDRYVTEFDAPTRAALSEVGGLAAIANTSEDRWSALQKRFATAYATETGETKALPATGTDGRVSALVRGTVQKLSLVPDYKSRAAGEEQDDD